jgi:hypothetical protein
VETLMRRARASGNSTARILGSVCTYYGSYRFEKVHPLQCGVLRRKVRTARRPGLPRENPLLFYPRRLWETVSTYAAVGSYYLWLLRAKWRIDRDPKGAAYTDMALCGPGAATANQPDAA